jgi:hypothetical protein
LTTDNFDFGIRIDYDNRRIDPQIFYNLDLYVDIALSQDYFEWKNDSMGFPSLNKVRERKSLGPCLPPRLG